MTLVKFNQPSKGQNVPVFSRLFNDFMENDFPMFRPVVNGSLPAVNISETDNSYQIEMSSPGFSKADISIAIEGDTLTISGEKKSESNEETKKYSRKEFSYQNFKRSFTLPEHLDSEKIAAKFEDGILRIDLPKKESAQPQARKIELQ
jgi:HSP20 family protein